MARFLLLVENYVCLKQVRDNVNDSGSMFTIISNSPLFCLSCISPTDIVDENVTFVSKLVVLDLQVVEDF